MKTKENICGQSLQKQIATFQSLIESAKIMKELKEKKQRLQDSINKGKAISVAEFNEVFGLPFSGSQAPQGGSTGEIGVNGGLRPCSAPITEARED